MMNPTYYAQVSYWMDMHYEAGKMLTSRLQSEAGWVAYFDSGDWAYVKAWQERQAYCYRQIERWREA